MTVLTSISALFFSADETRVRVVREQTFPLAACRPCHATRPSPFVSFRALPTRLSFLFCCTFYGHFSGNRHPHYHRRFPAKCPLTERDLEAMTQPAKDCVARLLPCMPYIGKILPTSWRPITFLSPLGLVQRTTRT